MNTEALGTQLAVMLILAIPISCVAWTVTHEEVFREPREFCEKMSREGSNALVRKFFYLFTCEYCFSHWVTMLALLMTGYTLLFPGDWRGYVLGGFGLVWIANIYMSLFARLRVAIKLEREEIKVVEKELGIEPEEPLKANAKKKKAM